MKEKYRRAGKPYEPVPWTPYWQEMSQYTLPPHVAAHMEQPVIGDYSDATPSPSPRPELTIGTTFASFGAWRSLVLSARPSLISVVSGRGGDQ